MVPNYHLSFILISEGCTQERGHCVRESGYDQYSGVITKNFLNSNTIETQKRCLDMCKQTDGATGCEVIWDTQNSDYKSPGCYVHTKEIAMGSGDENQACWVFSKCYGK